MSISNLLSGNSYKLTCAGLDAGRNKITNVAPPTEDYDCPNKAYVDAQASLAGTLSQVLAAGNDGNGDDMVNVGSIQAHSLEASYDLNGSYVNLNGMPLNISTNLSDAVKLAKDKPMVIGITNQGSSSNDWCPALNFYGKENIDRSIYFYGGDKSGNQWENNFDSTYSLKVGDGVSTAGKLTVGSPTDDNQTHEIWGSMKIVRSGSGQPDGSQVCELKLCGGDSQNDYSNTGSRLTMCSRTSEYMGDNFPDMRITVGNPTNGYDYQPIRFNVGAKAVSSSGNQNEFTMFEFNNTGDPNLLDDPGYYTNFKQPVQISGGIKGKVAIGRINQYSADCPLQIHDPRVGSMASGSMFIESGCTSDGGNVGWSALNWNGYYNNGDKVVNPNKLRWRQIVDQRVNNDKFIIETWAGPTPVSGWERNWLEFDAIEGYTTIGGALGIDFRPGIANLYVRPTVANTVDLGASSMPWKNVYSVSGITTTSDRNKKKDIKDISKGLNYINKLRPVEYKMINGTSDRVHCGLISQEVEEVNKSLGDMDGKNNALVVKSKKMVPDPDWVRPSGDSKAKAPLIEGKDYDYFLRYEELISPLIKAVQELSAQNAALVARVEALENA